MSKETDTPLNTAVRLFPLSLELAEEWKERAEKAEAEVERLTGRMKEAEDLIKGLHDGWKKARKAHLETCKNAQTEIDRLYSTNVYFQESEAVWKTEADKADQRRLEAETEVERLRGQLQKAVEIAEKAVECLPKLTPWLPLQAELNELKATLNPTEK
jgi:DNA repair exonuclease SbcCD ATPase subunit